MLKNFKSFLTEADGKKTALVGYASEHIINKFLNHYAKHRESGLSHTDAVEKIAQHRIRPDKLSDSHPIAKAKANLGSSFQQLHDDSRQAAIEIAHHLHKNYKYRIKKSHHTGLMGPKGVEKLTGKPSNADLVLENVNSNNKPSVAQGFIDRVKHIGSSLKYSGSAKSSDSNIKIHSPTLKNFASIVEEHHKMVHKSEPTLTSHLETLSQQHHAEQSKIIANHHPILAAHFGEDISRIRHNEKPCIYKPTRNKSGQVISGTLSHGATSYIRDSKDTNLREVYTNLSTATLKTKVKVAKVLHEHLHNIVATAPNHIKEKLFRKVLNVPHEKESAALATFLVSTSRNKTGTKTHIFDVNKSLSNHFKKAGYVIRKPTEGTTLMKFGPGHITVDIRPGTHGSIMSKPVNVTANKKEMMDNEHN